MATPRVFFPPKLAILMFLSISILVISVTGEFDQDFVRPVDRKILGLKKEKLSHFRFFWQDVVSGKNPSGVVVTNPSAKSPTAFGMVRIIDNPLTTRSKLNSTRIGRAQGFYASASKEEIGLLMVMNFVFLEGKYNGSTITVFGRNAVLNNVREMSVIGGSGLFRFARGYVEARTRYSNLKTGDATVQYDCYVMHY